MSPFHARFHPTLLLAAVLLVAGCASGPEKPTAGPARTFYPRPPAAPRLQLLAVINNELDLGRQGSKFAEFVVGKQIATKGIAKPYGVTCSDGRIYICDIGSSSVDVLDLKAQAFSPLSPSGEAQLITPINLAIDRDGNKYIADTARGQIVILNRQNDLAGLIGGKATQVIPEGNADVQGRAAPQALPLKPTDVLLSGDKLFVADLKSRSVLIFDRVKRTLLGSIPKNPELADAASKLYSPVNLAMDAQGRLYVSDIGAFRVQQYAPDGRFLRSFGLGAGDKPGEFARPKGVAVDRDGRVYVVDAGAQVVQIFDQAGRLLLYFGEPQPGVSGLDLPAKVALDYEHVSYFADRAAPGFKVEYLVLVTSQFGDGKLRVFGFGHQD